MFDKQPKIGRNEPCHCGRGKNIKTVVGITLKDSAKNNVPIFVILKRLNVALDS